MHNACEGLPVGSRPTWLELAVLIPLACAWFFWGTGVGDFVATEALRSVVVKEMLERGHGLLPTVHGRVYLRKPPLYAWTTLGLARAVGRFDEQVARWPSAAMAVLYVVILYFAGRWLVDVRAGPAAAVLGAGNWIVMDYGVRAELDTGVLALTTLAVLLLGWAWMNHGWRRVLGLTGCYVAALAGSFWKAPHVLLTVGLTLGGLAMMLAGAWALSGGPLQRRLGLGLAFLVMVAAIKPVHVVGYLPARSAATSLRPSARQIDSLVPAGTPAFVLSDKPGNDRSGELADFGYYCRTRLYWPMNVDEALQRAGGRWCYLLVQPDGKERIEHRLGESVEQIGQVNGGSKLVIVLRADRASTGHAVR